MAGLVTENFTSNGTCTIPVNSKNVTITVAGAAGAAGGNEGSGGGAGAKGTFKYKVNYVARSLDIVIGAVGSGITGGASNIASGGNGGTGIQTYPSTVTYSDVGYCTSNRNCYNICFGGGGRQCTVLEATISQICNSNFINRGCGAIPTQPDGSGFGVTVVTSNNLTSNGGGGGGATGIPGLLIAAGGGGSQGGVTVTAGANGSTFQSSDDYANGNGGISPEPLDNGLSPGLGGGGGGGGTARYSYYNSILLEQIGSSTTHSGVPYIDVTYELVDPEINSFLADPNPQTSGTLGIPSSSTILSWSTTFAETASINQNIGLVDVDNLTYPIDTGLQSVAGTLSPATKTYTLTACIGTNCVNQPITVSVFNDNTPTDFAVPNQTGLPPNQEVIIDVGNITGIDMKTAVVSLSGGCDFSISGNFYSASQTIMSGQNLKIRTFALGLNTSELGLVNTKTCQIKVGTLIKTFTVSTRAPVTAEVFDFENRRNEFPHPKIDTTPTITSPNIETVPEIIVDDIETQVRIKTNNGNTQVRVKSPGQSYGEWKFTESI